MITRRHFVKQTLAGSAFMGAFGISDPFPADRHRNRKSQNEKIRIIIETDAGGDPDDEQSMAAS